MKYKLYLSFLICFGISSAASAEAFLKKAIFVDFEPEEVKVVLKHQDNSISSLATSFNVIKLKNSKDNYLLNLVAVIPTGAQADSVLLSGIDPETKLFKGVCLVVESREVGLASDNVVAASRASILELRSTYSDSLKSFENLEREVEELRKKAASLARLNRLVEAQSTAISLRGKLEGLQSDKLNLSKLLDMVKNEQSSIRMSVSEAALANDLRLLSERAVSSTKTGRLNEQQRREAMELIQKARGLDIVSLREKVNKLNLQSMTDREFEKTVTRAPEEDLQALAAEYNQRNNLD